MHVAFRVLGQQMGLQAMRGILPESINVFLNLSQIEVIKSIIQKYTTFITKGNLSEKDDEEMLINSLNALLTEQEFIIDEGTIKRKFVNNKMIKYLQPFTDADIFVVVSGSITYKDDLWGEQVRCRVVNPTMIEDMNNDYLSCASHKEPLMTVTYDNYKTNKGRYIIVYAGKDVINMTLQYIKEPPKIADNETESVLPEYLNTEIVELAVSKFMQSVKSTSAGVQQ